MYSDDDGPDENDPFDLVARVDRETDLRMSRLSQRDRAGFISSDLRVVYAALESILERGLASGPLFCEWGSGLGAVCALAASLSLEAYGIEIQGALVEEAREMVDTLGLDATFAHGSFALPGDEDLIVESDQTCHEMSTSAYRELGITLEDCNLIYAYPWPGETEMYERLFARHAAPGTLLVTFLEEPRVLVQRRVEGSELLDSLGWFGRPRE